MFGKRKRQRAEQRAVAGDRIIVLEDAVRARQAGVDGAIGALAEQEARHRALVTRCDELKRQRDALSADPAGNWRRLHDVETELEYLDRGLSQAAVWVADARTRLETMRSMHGQAEVNLRRQRQDLETVLQDS